MLDFAERIVEASTFAVRGEVRRHIPLAIVALYKRRLGWYIFFHFLFLSLTRRYRRITVANKRPSMSSSFSLPRDKNVVLICIEFNLGRAEF